MKNNIQKLTSIICAVAISLTMLGSGLTSPTAAAMDASGLAAHINTNVPGLVAVESGGTVTVTGSATRSTTLELEIDNGVVVDWQANLTGSVRSAFLLNLKGEPGGVFTFSSGYINNTGAGGQINVEGAGLKLNINGYLSTSANGSSINIVKENVKVNISGTVSNSGSNSAINVTNEIVGVVININDGGSVISKPSGYAINDGSGQGGLTYANNTVINVYDGGLVEAGSACAIRSSGVGSVVNVFGGEVKNDAGSNPNSTIYMNGGTGDNINISGGKVYTINASTTSYVLQTTGNVIISGSAEVSALNGRAINLVGMDSKATVTGGTVETVNGTAICTATSTPEYVTNSSIEISNGGTVRATGTGTAVRVTGENSTVNISGGIVTAKQGFAVDASGKPGTGIGADTTPINISGGFVFAWGNNESKVVNTFSKLDLTDDGIIVAWNTTTGTGVYNEGDLDDLIITTKLSTGTAEWALNPDSSAAYDGFSYVYGTINGFFPLDVEVIQNAFMLTVVNGTAQDQTSFLVKEGTVLDIKVDPAVDQPTNPNLGPLYLYPVNGNVFKGWTSESGGIFGDDLSKITTFTMPSSNVTITANFAPCYLFEIFGGIVGTYQNPRTGHPSYDWFPEDEEFDIAPTAAVTGLNPSFNTSSWDTGDFTLVAPGSLPYSFKFKMPGGKAYVGAVTGTPVSAAKWTCTVSDGIILTTSGGVAVNAPIYECYSGTGLNIVAADPPPDNEFDHWDVTPDIAGGSAFNRFASTTRYTMPNQNIAIKAIYRDKQYSLSVDYGNGAGYSVYGTSFIKDEHVSVSTAPSQTGRVFSDWTFDSGGGEFVDAKSMTAEFTMPDSDAKISAHYLWTDYTLSYENTIDGTNFDIGIYNYNEAVTVIADVPPQGLVFAYWTSTGGGNFANIFSSTTTFTMPADDVTVMANYVPYVPPIMEYETNYTPISVLLQARKIVSGDGAVLEQEQFAFELYDAQGNLIDSATNDSSGGIAFAPIEYDQEGTHEYYVTETTQSGRGWIADGRDFAIVVDITDVNNELVSAISYPDSNSLPEFHNRYSADAAAADAAADDDPTLTPVLTPFVSEHIAYVFGYENNTIKPEKDISRAEVAMVFYRLLTDELRDSATERHEVPFPDVDLTRWYGEAVDVMSDLGVINGYPDGTFRPNAAITRAELAVISARFALMMRMAPHNHPSFSDISGHWAEEDIIYAAEIGWVNGYNDGTFGPRKNISRAEFITLVNRMLGRVPETVDDLLVDEMHAWSDNMDQDAWYYIAVQEASNSHVADYKEDTVPGLLVRYEFWTEMAFPE
ncbi:MAG: S-layer homology domain-containing protein [Oscillospiraceae bacterium]|nr:S-layer homology domain-containing protein [Oscillospiraceae bacterium]